MRSKQLHLNPDKTGYIIFGKKKEVDELRREMVPIMCGDFVTKEKVSDKWLGDMFHQYGLAASVSATIEDREPKVKGALYEAAAIVEDWRSQCIGGFRSAVDLWELAILPTLLYNSETWVHIPKVAEDNLEDLQLFFMRLILLAKEVTGICEKLGIEDVNISNISKCALKNMLEKACQVKDERDLLSKMGNTSEKLKEELI